MKKTQIYFYLQVQVSIIAGKTSGVSRHTLQIDVNHTLLDRLANLTFSDLDFFQKKLFFPKGPTPGHWYMMAAYMPTATAQVKH